MPNLLQRGASFLGSRLQTAAGREVVYSRKSQSVTLTGWPSLQEYEVDDEDGIPRRVTFYDWTFITAELDFANDEETFAARPGDQITVDGETYELMPPGKKPVAERLDAFGLNTLIHTKRVG